MEVLDLFPSPVIRFSNVISEEERLSILSGIKDIPSQKYPAIEGDGVSSFQTDSKILDTFGLRLRVIEKLSEYSRHVGVAPCRITNSWFSVQQPGSKLNQHNHPGSMVSGVIYVNVDEDSSQLFFDNPNEILHYTWWKGVGWTDYNCEYSTIEPKNGDLIMFPSWLKHGSMDQENKTKDRTIISFNSVFYNQ